MTTSHRLGESTTYEYSFLTYYPRSENGVQLLGHFDHINDGDRQHEGDHRDEGGYLELVMTAPWAPSPDYYLLVKSLRNGSNGRSSHYAGGHHRI